MRLPWKRPRSRAQNDNLVHIRARPTGSTKSLFSLCCHPELKIPIIFKCGLSFFYYIYYDAVSTADVIECRVLSLGLL
jgi:hypothetical protein